MISSSYDHDVVFTYKQEKKAFLKMTAVIKLSKFKKIKQHIPEIYPPSLFAKEQLFYWFPKNTNFWLRKHLTDIFIF